MSYRPRTRRQLVKALLETPDSKDALRVAREGRSLIDDAAARAVLATFHASIRGRRSRAEAAARAGAAIARAAPTAGRRAIQHRMSGILDHLEGRPRAAVRRLERSAALLVGEASWIDAGDVYRVLIDVHMLAEDDPSAKRSARRASSCYRRGGGADPRRRGSLSMNLGNLYHRRDEHQRALRAYSTARRWFRKGHEPIRLADVDFNRANILASLDRTKEARELYESARATYRSAGRPMMVAQAESAIAMLDLLEGELDACAQRLLSVREHQIEIGDLLGAAHSDLDAAEAFLRLNRPLEARRLGKRAESFFRRSGHRAELALCAGALAGAELQRGRCKRAATLFARGGELQERLGNSVGAAMLRTGQAQAEARTGDPSRAMDRALRSSRLLLRRGLRSRAARALTIGADAALRLGRLVRGRNWAERARSLARASRDLRVELAALMVLAEIERRDGHPDRSYRRLLAAERCVEKLRRGVTAEESRLSFALDKSEVFEALVLNRLQRGDRRAICQALRFAERGKARALAEHLAKSHVDLLQGGNPRTRRLLRRLSDVEKRLAMTETRLESPAPRKGLRTADRSALRALTRARSTTLDRLSRNDPQRAALVGGVLADPIDALQALGPNDLVLEYFQAGGFLHLFAIDAAGIVALRDIAKVDEVAELSELLRFQLGKGVLGDTHAERFGKFIELAIRDYMRRLYDLLLGPVADRLDGKSLRIVPHGVLHGLPFHAFEDGERALIDRCTPSFVPSLATLAMLAGHAPAPAAPPLVLGVPDEHAPLIENEVEAIRRHIGGARVFRGDRATRTALASSGRRPSLLHVACHGFYSEAGPWTSGLRLGDSWLSLSDLYNLQGTADLVVLSGCETGRGTVYSGDEWVGLVRGFLQAGARSVVASLWEVHDRSAVTLMDDFYGRLAGGEAVAEALVHAQRAARARDPLPIRWAPFVVIGEPALRICLRKVA